MMAGAPPDEPPDAPQFRHLINYSALETANRHGDHWTFSSISDFLCHRSQPPDIDSLDVREISSTVLLASNKRALASDAFLSSRVHSRDPSSAKSSPPSPLENQRSKRPGTRQHILLYRGLRNAYTQRLIAHLQREKFNNTYRYCKVVPPHITRTSSG